MSLLLVCIVATSIILMLPYSRLRIIKKVACAGTISLAISLGLSVVVVDYLPVSSDSNVTVTALNQRNSSSSGAEIWIKSIIVDGKSIQSDQIKQGSWIIKNNSLGWRPYDKPHNLTNSINFEISIGEKREIVFESNKWRGIARIDDGINVKIIDFYSETKGSEDYKYTIAPSSADTLKQVTDVKRGIKIGIFIVFVASILLLYTLEGKKQQHLEREKSLISSREIWADVLRIVCAFTVVWLHSTCNIYNKFTPDMGTWYNYLYVNSFTTFAVPCFFMVSGAFLIGKQDCIGSVLKIRVPRLLIPLVFWSIIYILVDAMLYNSGENIMHSVLKIPFEEQYSQAWFMYPLMGLYFLLPLLTFLYEKLDNKMKWYVMTLVLFVPLLMHLGRLVLSNPLKMPFFVFGFPYLGLFIVGKVIVNLKGKLSGAWKLPAIGVAWGFSMTVILSYYLSMKLKAPQKTFFSGYSLSVFILSSSVFALFLSLESAFQRFPELIKKIIFKLSRLSMGVYFVHILALRFLGNRYLGPLAFTNNAGSLIDMTMGATLYFVVSVAFSYVLSHIPYLKRVVI